MARTGTLKTSTGMKALALAAAIVLAAGSMAEARPGGGRSFGSRGANSSSPPPITQTAPRQAESLPGAGMNSPSSGYRAPQQTGSRFGGMGGLMGGLAAGFLGAGLFGMLFGGGFLSGLGSFAGLLGFIIQIALVVIVARLALNWWRRRNQPATAAGPQGYARSAPQPDWRPGATSMGAASGFGAAQTARAATQPIQLASEDFNRFEQTLEDIQLAYGRGDRATLSRLATPDVANMFLAELDENARRGVTNTIASPKLLQGDLAEAWSEAAGDYATVAMRYQIVDATIDKGTGRVVEGDKDRPQQVTEVWTFTRPHGSGPQGWALSAIQQA